MYWLLWPWLTSLTQTCCKLHEGRSQTQSQIHHIPKAWCMPDKSVNGQWVSTCQTSQWMVTLVSQGSSPLSPVRVHHFLISSLCVIDLDKVFLKTLQKPKRNKKAEEWRSIGRNKAQRYATRKSQILTGFDQVCARKETKQEYSYFLVT